jgi:hypothetical protein
MIKNFSNSYDLIHYLFHKNLLSGFYLGPGHIGYDLELESKIVDTSLLNHLETIFNSWVGGNAINQGDYILASAENGDLYLEVFIQDDVTGFSGNPFDIQEILSIVLNSLKISSFDEEEWYENFMELSIEFRNENNNSIFEKFNIELLDDEYISKKEFDNLKINRTQELKNAMEQYFIDNMEDGYSGFSVSIIENYFEVTGLGIDSYPIKDFFIKDNVEF